MRTGQPALLTNKLDAVKGTPQLLQVIMRRACGRGCDGAAKRPTTAAAAAASA